MPEGDTVYRAAQLLDRSLTGRVLTRTDFRVPQHATVDLSGARVVGTVSRGKHILTRIAAGPSDVARGLGGGLGDGRGDGSGDGLTGAWTLHTHLKMEGAWRVLAPGARWPRPEHQARVVLEVTGAVAVGFSLGIVELIDTAMEPDVVGHLGPDLLGPDWDEQRALDRLLELPERAVGESLLDQTRLAGVGNMYMAELCFTHGVHPATAVGRVRDLPRLVRRAKQMLDVNKERAVQSTTGNLRERERMWVYRRDRSPCRRCGTPVAVTMLGPAGRQRAAYWCPRCQPAPSDPG